MADLITTQQLKDAYLSGVKLADNTGQPLPDAVFTTALSAAASWFELKTKVHLSPIDIVDEQHDFNVEEYLNFCWLGVYEYPVISVSNVQAQYPTGQTILLFPSTWVKLRSKAGQIQLVPTAGTLSQVMLGQGGSYLPLLSGRLNHLPNLFLISYKAGFTAGNIPDAVNDAIGLRAAIHVMSAAGSMVIEPGIQSKSISIDGLSQSTAAMVGQFGPYSGRINEYNQRLTDLIDTITMEYKGIRMVVL
jgi:hypothetical protein